MTYDSGNSQTYLESTVHTASPAKLRLLLIERAIDVAGTLATVWRKREQQGPNELSLKLLDMLNELLAGITGGTSEDEKRVCQQVSDLYVFLAKHLVAAEEQSDADSIEEIATVLQVEAETWRAVCAQEGAQSTTSSPGGLNLQA